MIEKLLEYGFITGSRAFGTEEEDSDFDIVVDIRNMQDVQKIIGDSEKIESNYFSGFYIQDGERKINIIPVHPEEFEPWYLTTVAMKAIFSESNCLREQKYAMFQGIKSLFNMGDFKLKEDIQNKLDKIKWKEVENG